MTTKGKTKFVPVAAAIAIAAGFLLGGCKACRTGSALSPSTQQPPVSTTTAQAAAEVGKSANTIANHTTRIEAAAPDLHADTQPIIAAVGDLRKTAATLEVATIQAKTDDERVAALAAERDAAVKKASDLEDARNGLLSRLLTLSAVAGLALAVVSAVWLRSGQGLLTGLAVFGAAVAGQWILEYRVVIGLGTLGVAGAWAAWAMIRERKASTEVVKLVETVKPKFEADSFKTIANAIQSQSTKAIVDKIQKAIGVKKAAKP